METGMSELVQYREQRQPDPIMLIRQSGKAQSTITQYIRALEPYLAHGGNLGDPVALSEYAKTLSKSRRAHLRSAVALWAKSASALLKATATPENLEKTQAALMRLEALPQAIQTQEVKGQKAHIWLSPKQVKELMNTCGSDVVGLRDRTVLGLLVGAGLRRAELADLTWESVVQQPAGDKMRTVLEVRGKGAKDRVVPISAKLAALLDEWAAVTGREGHIVRSLGMAQVALFSVIKWTCFGLTKTFPVSVSVPILVCVQSPPTDNRWSEKSCSSTQRCKSRRRPLDSPPAASC
jgi:site-specific recombinase XerC